jgi:hypothetical protein
MTSHPARTWSGYLAHRYDISGLFTIGSEVPLRELEYFRAPWLGRHHDIEIRVGHLGNHTHRRTVLKTFTSPPGVSYEEQLGRLGANFRVDLDDRVQVTVTSLLARSPHVLYTNIIEALLRFLLVAKGRMLLHSGCLELEGHGVLLSARTDTGKTGTILRLLREKKAGFLSDDMTILAPSGQAWCFPKPLTISQHTLRAINIGELTLQEWRRLRLQSRLHSREGRRVGMRLAELNLPIMGLNAVTQLVVPPPKYVVDRLVDCDVLRTVKVEDVFILERGRNALAHVGKAEALKELIENTDDAYGFPPFSSFAPNIVINDEDYTQLREKERSILAEALSGMRIRRLASDNFAWAEAIPLLISDRHTERSAPLASVIPLAHSTPEPATGRG